MYKVSLVLLIPLILLFACRTDMQKNIISYELEHNLCKIKGAITISEKPFHALDSMKILRKKYSESKKYHIDQLKISITELQTEIKLKEQEAETIENTELKNYFTYRLEQMKAREIQLKENIVVYQLHPEKTQLNVYLDGLAQYAKDSNTIIALKVDARFEGIQGSLDPQFFNKQYLTSTNNRYIIEISELH